MMNKGKGGGLRYNKDKVRFDLIPSFAQEQYAKILTMGAKKYEERNWERGMKWSDVLASLERHLEAFKRGEDVDPESGLLHVAHIMCNAAFLTEYYKIYPQGDDRPHNYLSRPKIMLDIDEVICDWVGGWVNKFRIDLPKNWFFDREIIQKFDNLRKTGELDEFYLSLEPRVSPDDIPFEPWCYVTSRPVSTEVTETWLDKHGFPSRPVHTVGVGMSKVEVLKEAGGDMFVDDRYENFIQANNAGICAFLMDAPHNQRYNVGHKRIFKLSDIFTGDHLIKKKSS